MSSEMISKCVSLWRLDTFLIIFYSMGWWTGIGRQLFAQVLFFSKWAAAHSQKNPRHNLSYKLIHFAFVIQDNNYNPFLIKHFPKVSCNKKSLKTIATVYSYTRAKNSAHWKFKEKVCMCRFFFFFFVKGNLPPEFSIEDTFIALQFFNDVAKDDDEGEDWQCRC